MWGAASPLRLDLGWSELWEHGRLLGLFDSFDRLDSYIQRHPKRFFVVRFMGPGSKFRSVERFIGPIGSFGAEAGPKSARFFDLGETHHGQPH
jgi:hypothetical protein